MWPSQIKKLVELVDRAERSNEPSTTARQQTDRQTDTIEIPPTEILDRIFIKLGCRADADYFLNCCTLGRVLDFPLRASALNQPSGAGRYAERVEPPSLATLSA